MLLPGLAPPPPPPPLPRRLERDFFLMGEGEAKAKWDGRKTEGGLSCVAGVRKSSWLYWDWEYMATGRGGVDQGRRWWWSWCWGAGGGRLCGL